jgi:hypothetical protein
LVADWREAANLAAKAWSVVLAAFMGDNAHSAFADFRGMARARAAPLEERQITI